MFTACSLCTTSHSQVISQAGQVWYPDSAYKTAQAIKDFGLEQLPLFIFANWRGFSGGMRGELHAYGDIIQVYHWYVCVCNHDRYVRGSTEVWFYDS